MVEKAIIEDAQNICESIDMLIKAKDKLFFFCMVLR